jgi:DNA-binding transcriptional regulator LsrR (DeoR family)
MLDQILKVARLYYENNLTQNQIADRLNISRVKVYRLLIRAREEGVVNIELRAPAKDFSKLEIDIEDQYGIIECKVVPSTDSTEILYNGLAGSLTAILKRELKDDMLVGFGWGNTIRGVVERISMTKQYKATVVPTIGGFGSSDEHIHANSIATLAARKLGGKALVLNCPAIMDSVSSREVFQNESSVKSVLNQWPRLDIAVLPIGYMGYDITMRKSDNISKEDVDYLKSLNVVGDVNSNFIDPDGRLVDNQIQERIINVTLEDLKKIKHRIAVCFGKKKIEATRAVLKSGAIDTIIIDSEVAENLLT